MRGWLLFILIHLLNQSRPQNFFNFNKPILISDSDIPESYEVDESTLLEDEIFAPEPISSSQLRNNVDEKEETGVIDDDGRLNIQNFLFGTSNVFRDPVPTNSRNEFLPKPLPGPETRREKILNNQEVKEQLNSFVIPIGRPSLKFRRPTETSSEESINELPSPDDNSESRKNSINLEGQEQPNSFSVPIGRPSLTFRRPAEISSEEVSNESSTLDDLSENRNNALKLDTTPLDGLDHTIDGKSKKVKENKARKSPFFFPLSKGPIKRQQVSVKAPTTNKLDSSDLPSVPTQNSGRPFFRERFNKASKSRNVEESLHRLNSQVSDLKEAIVDSKLPHQVSSETEESPLRQRFRAFGSNRGRIIASLEPKKEDLPKTEESSKEEPVTKVKNVFDIRTVQEDVDQEDAPVIQGFRVLGSPNNKIVFIDLNTLREEGVDIHADTVTLNRGGAAMTLQKVDGLIVQGENDVGKEEILAASLDHSPLPVSPSLPQRSLDSRPNFQPIRIDDPSVRIFSNKPARTTPEISRQPHLDAFEPLEKVGKASPSLSSEQHESSKIRQPSIFFNRFGGHVSTENLGHVNNHPGNINLVNQDHHIVSPSRTQDQRPSFQDSFKVVDQVQNFQHNPSQPQDDGLFLGNLNVKDIMEETKASEFIPVNSFGGFAVPVPVETSSTSLSDELSEFRRRHNLLPFIGFDEHRPSREPSHRRPSSDISDLKTNHHRQPLKTPSPAQHNFLQPFSSPRNPDSNLESFPEAPQPPRPTFLEQPLQTLHPVAGSPPPQQHNFLQPPPAQPLHNPLFSEELRRAAAALG